MKIGMQIKDSFYDEFLTNPNRDTFTDFIESNIGEFDNLDFKSQWIVKSKLVKLIISMANSGGGIIVFGIEELEDGSFSPLGLSKIMDEAAINDMVTDYISTNLHFRVLNFNYENSEYIKMVGKMFQVLVVENNPQYTPYFALRSTAGLEKNDIYVRRGTKCEKASKEELEAILEMRLEATYKKTSDLELEEHLEQLNLLYSQLPKKINVLIRKGEPSTIQKTIQAISFSFGNLLSSGDEYEEIDNPSYPTESYEDFVLRMIKQKKIKVEKVLDLK